MKLNEADLNKGRIGVELEMLVRNDVLDRRQSIGSAFVDVMTTAGFTLGSDPTIVKHTLSKDIYYTDFETANLELEGTKWDMLEGRLGRVLGWLKQRDQVWVDRRERTVQVEGNSKNPAMLRVVLPRAKMPNNASCGLHLHFHADDWFKSMDHAVAFADLWNYAMDFFKEEVNPERYERGDESYTAQGEEYAKFTPLKIPEPKWLDLLKKEWSELGPQPEDEKNAYMVRRILHWMARNRWTAMNLTKVDVRKDVEFRFMHGTLNIETVIHWVALIAALIEAAEVGSIKNFRRYLSKHEPDLLASHDKRAKAMSKADTSHASVWHPPVKATRAVRRLVAAPGEELELPISRQAQPPEEA